MHEKSIISKHKPMHSNKKYAYVTVLIKLTISKKKKFNL